MTRIPHLMIVGLLLFGCARPQSDAPPAPAIERPVSVETAYLYEQILQVDPENAEAHFQLGNVRYQQKQPDLAEYHWRQAITFNPHHTQAHINLGLLMRQLGRSR